MREAGLRAFVGKLSMDISSRPTYVESSAEASLAAAASFADKCASLEADVLPHERLIEPVLTPRFVPTCSDALLRGLGDLSRDRNLRVQSHMAEAHDQVAWVREERGMDDMEVFDKVYCLFSQYDIRATLTWGQNGLLTPRTVQAHCTFLDPPSLKQVAENQTAVAHCPLSNAYFSSEPFRLREALRSGVRVGLGTDIAGGYDISIMSAMRHAVVVSRMREGSRVAKLTNHAMSAETITDENLSIDWKEALYLATKGGSEALGLKTGIFEVGAPFDAQQSECVRSQVTLRGCSDLF